MSGKFWILRELAVFPTGETLPRANPKRAVACHQQVEDFFIGELLTAWRLPGNGANAIETIQAKFRAQPEIAVWRRRHRKNPALGKPVANLPRRVRILAHIQRRIQSEGTRAYSQQHHARQQQT